MNTNENAVGAVFPNEAAADAAIASLHSWDVKVKDVELGAIGTVKLENGKAKVKVKEGGFFTRSLKLDDDDMALIVQHLDGEKVCVVVRSDDYEVTMVRTHLKNAGGTLAEFRDPYTAEERAERRRSRRGRDEHAQLRQGHGLNRRRRRNRQNWLQLANQHLEPPLPGRTAG